MVISKIFGDQMKVKQTVEGKSLVMSFEGKLDENSSAAVEEEFDRILAGEYETVQLDLSAIAHISSIGIRTLIVAHKKAVKQGKRIIIKSMSAKSREMLEIVGILPLFTDEGS